jgi:malate dehydrogenase
MSPPTRIAVTGAGGQIGYALAFRVALGGLFGADHPVILSLMDRPENMPVLQALEMELTDCTFPLLKELRIGHDPFAAFRDAEWVILLGSRGWASKSASRIELLRESGPAFVEYGRAIQAEAPSARILVVANPCNTNCLIARSHAPAVLEPHWFAMNQLDRMRATALVAAKAGVAPTEVSRVIAWGNHSESVFVDFDNIGIRDRPAGEVIHDPAWVRDVFHPTVSRRTSEILKRRGSSPAASTAQAILTTIRAVSSPTPHQHVFGACVTSDGSYGVPRGLVFGFPLRTEDGSHWSIVEGLYHDAFARERIAANVAELNEEAAAVSDLVGSFR